MALLADFVAETSSAPGTSTTINLAGVVTPGPFKTFASAFTTGSKVFYTISDEVSQRETGVGTFTAGSPNTLSRDTVTATTSGASTARLNFIGTVYVYCSLPASKALFIDENGTVPSLSLLTLNANSAAITTSATVGTTLAVAGTSTLHATNIIGATAITGNTTITGNETVSGTAAVAGNTSLHRTDILGNGALGVSAGTYATVKIDPLADPGILINSVPSPPANFSGLVVNMATAGSFMSTYQFGGNIIGSITITGGGSGVQYNATSDATLKDDEGLIEATEAAKMLLTLKPRWFRWKSNPDIAPEPGFFAQQVNRVFPWAVTKGVGRKGRKDYRPWMMDNSKLVPLLTAVQQAALKRADAQDRRIAALEKALAKALS